MDRQVCVIKTVAYRARTDTRTDKKVKTEGPKILSNDIFYFKTVVIGGPIPEIVKIIIFYLNFLVGVLEL